MMLVPKAQPRRGPPKVLDKISDDAGEMGAGPAGIHAGRGRCSRCWACGRWACRWRRRWGCSRGW
ncbi:MAG: hypothetical protein WKG07_04420 [Hymenobacter sp.]